MILLKVIAAPLRKINNLIARSIPEGKFKDFVTRDRSAEATQKPDLDSLRRGL